ncbi:Uncharacterised protein [Bordetella pertussis]|nr:Uncharacterised protein [Bordetella pertussis]
MLWLVVSRPACEAFRPVSAKLYRFMLAMPRNSPHAVQMPG